MMMALLSSCETEAEKKMENKLLILKFMAINMEEQNYNDESARWFMNNTPLDSITKAHIKWIGNVNDSLRLAYDSLELELEKH